MQSRIVELPASRNYRMSFGFFLFVALLSSVMFLSACSTTQPLRSGSTVSDSLAENLKREFVIASLQSAKGEYRGAADRYQKLLSVQPSNAAIHYALSKAYFGLGVLDSARLHSEKSVSLNPDNKYYLGYLAALSHEMHDYGRAADLYRQIAVLEPGSTEPLASLALEYLAADQPEKALSVFHEISALDPKDEATQLQMLFMEIQLTHYQDAIGTLTGLIEQGDGKEKLRLTLGELYLQTKQYDLASKTFRELLSENPASLSAWLSLFEVSVQSGNHPVFHDDLDRFYNTGKVTLDQKIDLAKLFLVRSYRETSFTDPAYVMIGEIIRRFPGNSQIYALRGTANLQKQDAAAAVIDFKKALILTPGRVAVWEDLVTAYLIQKQFRLAEVTLHKAKKRFPSMTFRLRLLEGELLFQTGKVKKAAVMLEALIRQKNAKIEKSLYLQACTTLAFCYDKLGLSDKSIRLYESILKLEPTNLLMTNNLAYLLALQGKELLRAKELAMKAVAAEPANAGYLDTLGWVLFRMAEYEQSREILEKAVGLDPREAEISDHLGQVYEKLGNLGKANEMKEKVRKLKAK
ncbi:MAG: tetratricopeptide repeat protein [Chlorobiaceae bacterium]|nr:tetratricopeptide repeat protein [Chlorobiaceae bacterium]